MCGLMVNNNRFGCHKGDCATLESTFVPEAAAHFSVGPNQFEGVGLAKRPTKSACKSQEECKGLFGACDERDMVFNSIGHAAVL